MLLHMLVAAYVERRIEMKYFTPTLWEKINDLDEETRDKAIKEWGTRYQEYEEQFSRVSKKLPSEFLKVYKECSCFHDYRIKSILYQDARESTVTISLGTRSEAIDLAFCDVQHFSVNILDKTPCIMGQLSWGYCEFEADLDNAISINILCDMKNEIKIVFKSIMVGQKNALS